MVRIHNTYTNMRCRTAMCSVLIRAVPWKWRASEEKSISVKMNRRQESINRINKYVESAHFHRKCWYDNKIVIHFEGAALNLIIKLCIHIVAHLRYHDAWLSFVLRTYLHFVCYPISSNLCCSLLLHVVFLFFIYFLPFNTISSCYRLLWLERKEKQLFSKLLFISFYSG